VNEPGVYADIPEDLYHADRSTLSVSGAKNLLPPSCPALYRYYLDHKPQKAAWDFGHAAHGLVLGVGAPVVKVDAEDWRTKAAKDERDAAYAEGKVPILRKEWDQVVGMADAISEHPIASALFDPAHGKPEQSFYWDDATHGVRRRGRWDWLPETDGGRLIVPDYKTAPSAEPGAIRKAVANFGYHMQAAWYIDGAHALGLADDISFVLVFQERTAPYLITVCELDADALFVGRQRNDQALQVFAECTATDTWPAYSDDVELISLPGWATYDQRNAA
jgi:hypothetical protein